jgi:UDP-glucose 4-epimerase
MVAGARGAIGRHVVAQLRAAGWRVAGLGHGPDDWAGDGAPHVWQAGDVSPDRLQALADRLDGQADLLINLAGGSAVGPSVRDPAGDFHRTVTTSVHILDFIRIRSPDTRLVAVSSIAVYGDRHVGPIAEDAELGPISPYGFWARTFGVQAVIVRPSSVYGPGLRKQMVFDLCLRLAKAGDEVRLWGAGTEARDWLAIQDVARLLIDIAAFASPQAPVYNACTGEARTVAEVARLLCDAWGGQARISFDGVVRAGDPLQLVGSAERLATTGFRPRIALEDGLKQTVAEVKQALARGET